MGLGPFAERDIAGLSGGQRQRVAIARMLARQVECVIADEPTANLDPALTAEAMRLFRHLAEQVPVVIITHDPAVADACDRTIVLQSAVTTPGSTPAPRPQKRRRRALWALGAGVAIAAIAAAALALTGGIAAHPGSPGPRQAAHASTRPALAKLPTAPAPHLADFVPASQRVLQVYRFNLDSGVPEVAVTTTSQPTADTPNQIRQICAHHARRHYSSPDAPNGG